MSSTDVKFTPTKTWIPVTGLGAFVVFGFWIGVTYQQILSAQDDQGKTLQRLELKIDGVGSQFVTKERFDAFIELLRASNPTLTVPVVTR